MKTQNRHPQAALPTARKLRGISQRIQDAARQATREARAKAKAERAKLPPLPVHQGTVEELIAIARALPSPGPNSPVRRWQEGE